MESDADRLAMIKSLGGQIVCAPDREFWAVFDREFSVDGAVESRQPVLNARDIDLQTLAKDTVVAVDGENFRIKRLEPDGTGMTLAILKR
jgi:hypothetical protein